MESRSNSPQKERKNIHSLASLKEAKSAPIYSPVSDLALNLRGLKACEDEGCIGKHGGARSTHMLPETPRSRFSPIYEDDEVESKDSLVKKMSPRMNRFTSLITKPGVSKRSPIDFGMKSSALQRFRQITSFSPLCEYDESPGDGFHRRDGVDSDLSSHDGYSPDPQQLSCSLDSSSLQDTPSNVAIRPFSLDLSPTPVKTSPIKKIAIVDDDESSQDSGVCLDSGEIKETEFKFPLGPAPRPRSLLRVNSMPNDSDSPSRKTFSPKRFSAMPPTALCFSPTTDGSPLKCSPLTSLDDDDESPNDANDDGFVDVFGDDKENDVPSNLSSLFNAPVLVKPETTPLRIKPPAVRRLSEEPTPETIRRGLFRSPSMPNKLALKSRCHSFDMRSRPFTYKRSEREDDSPQVPPLFKRRRSVIDSQNEVPEVPVIVKPSPRTLQRCKSEIAIKTALSRADCEENLIGDCSREYCLPRCRSKHEDLIGISSSTLKDLMNGEYDHVVEKYLIVDCRYPYEYDGGHINGAVNLYTKEEIFQTFLESSEWRQNPKSDKRVIVIFHCEFSSERGPRMSRFVRNHDRDVNKDNYPSLFYPELYLLEGGYKAFYEQVPDLCHNGQYKTMLDTAHSNDLKFFRAKSKSWSNEEKKAKGRGLARHKSRTTLVKQDLAQTREDSAVKR